MDLFTRFYPKNYIESAYEIPYAALYEQGFRGVLFDIDNTLVEHGAPADDRSVKLFHALHQVGFKTMLLSNNKEPRVKSFAEAVETQYIHKAGKPRILSYEKAMEIMGTRPATTIFVGDQLFTDIWGANAAGMQNYLVKQIDKKEEIQIVLKRFLEKPVMYFYMKNRGR